jgi:hypothetical protein
MTFTYSRYLKPEFRQWVNEHLAVIQEFFTPEVAEEYGTLEDWAVELYLTIKAGY